MKLGFFTMPIHPLDKDWRRSLHEDHDCANWRMAKSIFVAEDAATARDYATDPDGPYVGYYRSLHTKLKKNGRIGLFKTHKEQPDDEVTLDHVCEKLVIYGIPDKVVDDLLAFREQVGDLGTVLYAGEDWLDRDLGRLSMKLLAEKVLPRLDATNAPPTVLS